MSLLGACEFGKDSDPSRGGLGQPCNPGNVCDGVLICRDGTCQARNPDDIPCGGHNMFACKPPRPSCDPGLQQYQGVCTNCGLYGQLCCTFTCYQGFCSDLSRTCSNSIY